MRTFIFPNDHSIYLRDTPADHLFYKYERDLSHGCIRLESPIELAVSLLKEREDINRDSIIGYVRDTIRKRIYLRDNVRVFFTYQTAMVDRKGALRFRRDIYALDEKHYLLREQKNDSANIQKCGLLPATIMLMGILFLNHLLSWGGNYPPRCQNV